jgi:DHA2 family multidrug resistance protein
VSAPAVALGASTVTASTATTERHWLKDAVPFMVMCFGMFIALLDIQIVASSLQDIGGGLSAAQDQISWVQTSYLIAEIVMIPLSGWLTRVFSTRWLFVASAAGFTAASVLCALAWNIQSMIVFRALQGALGASMIPTVFTSSFHYFQGVRRVYSAAVIGTIASVAPTLGPVIGGWITDTLDWRWLFYVNVLPGIAVTVLVALLVKIDKPDLKLLKEADYPGIALLAVALGTLEYVLEEGARWNWFDDETIRLCAWTAAVSGGLFFYRSLTFARPVVDLRAFLNRNFAIGSFLSFVTGAAIFSPIYLTPLFLGYIRGYDASQIGLAIFSTGAASLIGVPVYIALAKRFDTRWLMMAGIALFGAAMMSFSGITSVWSGTELFVPQVLRGFPQVFAVAPAVNLGLGSLPPERLKYASGLFNMMRNLGGAVGIAISGAILNDRTNLHFERIASNLTPANGAMMRLIHGVAGTYGAVPGAVDEGQAAALRQLFHLAYREAATLAYADAFQILMVGCFAAALVVPLMKKVAAVPAAASSNAH